jgi:hypothetical protein
MLPIVWFVIFQPRVALSYGAKLVLAELFAWLGESAYFKWGFGARNALGWALVANAASMGLAMVSRALFGGP